MLLNVTVFLLNYLFAPKGSNLHPIILVPGDGGSQIEARVNRSTPIHFWCYDHTDWFDLWLNIEQLLPPAVYCWEQNIRLRYNRKTRKTSNARGVETRIPGFGDTFTVEYLDKSRGSVGYYFNSIVDDLVKKHGYIRAVNIHGAPYDFRLAANEQKQYFIELKKLFEKTYESNGGKPVILISHSMGSLMALHFLQSQTQAWKDKYVVRFVSLAGAWAGTAQAVRVFTEGTDLNSKFLSEKHLLWERTCPSLAWLMPNSNKWDDKDVLIQLPDKQYTRSNLTEFFKSLSNKTGTNMEYMMEDTKDLLHDLAAPNVPMDCIHSSKYPTPEKLVYPPDTFPLYDPKTIYGDGDGTVNIRSLETCLEWKDKQEVNHVKLENLEHLSMLRSEEVIKLVSETVAKINGA